MCATPIQVMGGQGDWLGPMPPDTLGLSFLHKGSPQEGCSVLERQRLPKGLKNVKNMFFPNLSWENCFQRARIAPAKPGKKGGQEGPPGKGPPQGGLQDPPVDNKGGWRVRARGTKLALISSLRRLRQ